MVTPFWLQNLHNRRAKMIGFFLCSFQETITQSKNKISFIKVHAPWSLLCRYAEELNLRAPLQVKAHQDQFPIFRKGPRAFTTDFRKTVSCKILCTVHSLFNQFCSSVTTNCRLSLVLSNVFKL